MGMTMTAIDSSNKNNRTPAEVLVGRKLRELRARRGFSLRVLADRSGLNINTLCLVENGKSSPSVSTLQQLAQALDVPISIFFESEPVENKIVHTLADQRPHAAFGKTEMQNLGKDFIGSFVQPFIVTLQPGAGSGDRMIVHTGFEFVYCLYGTIRYCIDDNIYILNPDDSLIFESNMPHCWENDGKDTAQILLILYPSDKRDEPGGRHFLLKE